MSAGRLSRQKTGLVLILAGVVCFGVIFSFKSYQKFRKKRLSFSQSPELITEVKEELSPAQILIPSLRIDLPVYPAKIVDRQWEISEKGASYLLGSGLPGREGNVVIYGHNKNSLFGPIRWLEKDREIKVINKKGEEFIYKVVGTKTVSLEKVEVLSPTKDATLTLYTCTGFFDRERFVVVAKFVR